MKFCHIIYLHSKPRVRMGQAFVGAGDTAGAKRQSPVRPETAGSVLRQFSVFGFRAPAQVLNWILNQSLQNIFNQPFYILFIYACIYKCMYSFILVFHILLYFMYVISYGMIFMCILLYMAMCMLMSATSTHFKWELMLYCLHCPTLNTVFTLTFTLLTLEK